MPVTATLVRGLCLFCGCLLLAGCIGTPQRIAAPVTEGGSTLAEGVAMIPDVDRPLEVEESSGVVLRAYEPPAPIAARPIHSRAVVSLIEAAGQQERSGDLAAAVGTVERALRIEPRNAHLWYRLARLRLAQHRGGQALDLAMKSMGLAGADKALKRDNWLLIAKAKRAQGDSAGAQVAERKARMLLQ